VCFADDPKFWFRDRTFSCADHWSRNLVSVPRHQGLLEVQRRTPNSINLKMKIIKSLLAAAAASMLLLSTAHATQKSDECYSFLKAGDYSRALQSGRQAVRETPQSLDANFCLGRAYKDVGDLDNAQRVLLQAERVATQKLDLAAIYSLLGIVVSNKGDLQQALNYHSRALAIAREFNNKSNEATSLNNIAVTFADMGDSDKAIDYLQLSIRAEPNEDKKASTYNNLGMRYADKGDIMKSLEFLEKAISIDRRSGKYHSAAMTMLNKGFVLTKAKSYDESARVLNEGLVAIRKVGDSYWEAVGMNYLGNLYRARNEDDKALQSYKAALKLAKASGATTFAEDLARKISEQQIVATAVSFGVIEIGSKGVKAAVVTTSRDQEGKTHFETGLRHSINTDVISGVVDTGEFSQEAIKNTVDTVKLLIKGIKLTTPNWNNTITIAGSSAMSSAMNRDELAERLQKETGITPFFINSSQELSYAIKSTNDQNKQYKTALLDIGSGNARVGYLISPKGGNPPSQAVIDINAGSVTLTELANKSKKPGEDFVSALNRVVEQDFQAKYFSSVKLYPVVKKHNYFMIVGGAAWSMSTLLHPGDQSNSVALTRNDFNDYYAKITQNPDQLLNPDLSSIADPKLRDKAAKEIEQVKKVFTLENLQAGARILKMIADADPFGNASIYFSRDGNWAYGLAESQALVKQ
jgi:tetratricopeptide (TPR) repeat protein